MNKGEKIVTPPSVALQPFTSLGSLRQVAGLAVASAEVTERNNGITLSEREWSEGNIIVLSPRVLRLPASLALLPFLKRGDAPIYPRVGLTEEANTLDSGL